MDKKAVLESISLLNKQIESKGIKIAKVILFGSYAENRFTESSDIDLVIISDDFIGKSYWERINILSDAIYEVFQPIEAVALTSQEWEKGTSFIVDYAKNGETVYAA